MLTLTERRGPISAEFTGPGPLAYGLRTTIGDESHCLTKGKAPSFTLGRKANGGGSVGPGAGSYVISSDVTRKGKQQLASFTMKTRQHKHYLVEGIDKDIPGPSKYNAHDTKCGVLSKESKAPCITISARTNKRFLDQVPPPNKYSLPDNLGKSEVSKKASPQWTITGRCNHPNSSKINPGPAKYASTDPDVYRSKSSSYSMQPRTKRMVYNSSAMNPGPGSYNPQSSKAKKGSYMGIRHSAYVLPMIIDPDV